MKKIITESQLRSIVKECVRKVLKEAVEGEAKSYHIDLEYVSLRNGQRYGDMNYNSKEFQYPSAQAAIKNIFNSLKEKWEDDGIHRTPEDPDICILTVVDDEGNSYYSVANCSKELARKYNINADKYFETIDM